MQVLFIVLSFPIVILEFGIVGGGVIYWYTTCLSLKS